MSRFAGVVLCALIVGSGSMLAQQTDAFSRTNTWTVFAEYSNTSSHILMGTTRQRELADLGFGYTRRVVRFWGSDLSYQTEVRPVLFESDPLTISTGSETFEYPPPDGPFTLNYTDANVAVGRCQPGSGSGSIAATPGLPAETYSYTTRCGRQWTFAQAFSPVGFRYSMRTMHPVQPFVVGTLGYMYSSRPIPVSQAEAFNFVFDFGAGVEVFRSEKGKRSVSVECRYHHFSNKDTAVANPGTDNVMLKASYSFGR